MDDLQEHMAELFDCGSTHEIVTRVMRETAEYKWEATPRRPPGSGQRGPAVEERKASTRRRNLAARRAANRAHYAQQGLQSRSRVKQFQLIESGTRHG